MRLSAADRIRIEQILLDLEVPFEEFYIYDRLTNNRDLRANFRQELSNLTDDGLIDRLPQLDTKKLMRFSYWSLQEACSVAVGWPHAVMELPLGLFIPPQFDGDDDALGLESAKVRYDEIAEIARRAVESGEIEKNPRPMDFLVWASRYPDLLSETFSALSPDQGQQTNDDVVSIGTRERRTLLKIIYVLAINELGWSPEKNTSAVQKLVKRIEQLSSAGLNVTVGERTIRAKLKSARDVVHGDD